MTGDLHAPGDAIYRRKLSDPRWQRLAAEIKERDGWECFLCGLGANSEAAPGEILPSLEVHHKRYTTAVPGVDVRS